jgi:predicted dehydrogenase
MLDIGLVGLGPDWETCYKPALIRLRPRLRVRSVHTAVATRAEPVAAEFDCRPAASLTSLIERADLKAIVVLDPGWCGAVPVELALDLGKPVFFANSGALPRDLIPRLAERSARTGVMLMPDLRIRYLPSTIRLRELIATRIGRPLSVEARWDVTGESEPSRGKLNARLVEVFDWFRAIAGTPPRHATSLRDLTGAADGTSGCEIEFTRPAKGGEPLHCRLTTVRHGAAEQAGPSTARPVELSIRCERGSARISHPTEIEWSGSEPDEPLRRESLTGEREDLELMLDHFARRVAGGLVPVPTFEDLQHAWSLRDSL